MNLTVLTGRLGKDPETKYTTGGKTVTKFSLAVDSFSGKEKTTDWFNIVAWDKLAENAGKFLTKGSKAAIVGRLSVRSYEKNGETKYVTEIVASQIEFLDSKSDAKPKSQSTEIDDSDLPF